MKPAHHSSEVLPLQLAEILPGIVYQILNKPDGLREVLYLNQKKDDALGLTSEEFAREINNYSALVHPDDRERISAAAREHNQTLEPWSQRYRIVLPGRGIRWMRSIAYLERHPSGGALWSGFVMDVTQDQQANDALWLSEKTASETWKYSEIGMALVSLEGRWMEANPAMCRFFGRTEEELLATDFQSLTYPADLAKDLDLARQLVRNEIKTYTMEKRYLGGQGQYFWGLLTVAMVRDAQGNPLHFISQVQDIDQRKRTEHDLQLSEERIALAARAGHVGMWDYDLASGQIIWNDAQYEIHGVTRENYQPSLGQNLRFLHSEDVARVIETYDNAVQAGVAQYEIECRIVRPDGEIRTTRSNALFIRDDRGQVIRAVGTEVDVTEEKNLMQRIEAAREAAEAAASAKSDFLARMSHEIRTPMNAILAPAQLLATGDIPASQRGLAAMIVEAGEHLLQIINDILDFSKLEAGKMKLTLERFDLAKFATETTELMSFLAQTKGITLRQEFSPEVAGDWLGDAGRIKQVLLNLVANAIKFTPAGEVTLRVKPDEDGNGVRFEVRDSGIGLSREEQKILFRPFEQTPVRHKNYQSGTGLGLAICRDLVELMGGRIGVESALEKGSTFWFTISLSRCPDPPQTVAPELSQALLPQSEPIPGARILVVEDNASNRRVAAFLLARLGHQVQMAENGQEAVDKFDDEAFDLIFMDCEMPVMNGMESARAIRLKAEGRHRIPIVALTAHVSADQRRACLNAGMDDMLSKPILMLDLERILSRWLPHAAISP